jgi:hypothetical protein
MFEPEIRSREWRRYEVKRGSESRVKVNLETLMGIGSAGNDDHLDRKNDGLEIECKMH